MREKKTLLENFISLLTVQFGNYFLQLITFPYLVRVLGIAGFGLYSFVFAFAQYFLIITDYGFNLTATRKISIARTNKEKVANIFSTVYATKILLFTFSSIAIIIITFLVPKFQKDHYAYLLTIIAIFGNFLFPVWYYQGIEKTKYIALFNSIAKIITTGCIFIFIKNPNDIYLAIFIQSMSVVVSAVISIAALIKYWPVKLVKISFHDIQESLIDGWYIFITIFSASLVNSTNIFILGLFASNQTVGYFSIAEKIVRVFHSLVAPLSTAIFPHVSKLVNESKEKAISFLNSVLKWGLMGFALCTMSLIVLSGIYVKIFTGNYSFHIQSLIIILSVLPITIFIDNIFGQQILVNIGSSKEFMKGILIPGLSSLLLSFALVPKYKEYASAVIFLCAQLAIMIFMVHYSHKKDIYLLKNKIL